jgi:hypothetical protein
MLGISAWQGISRFRSKKQPNHRSPSEANAKDRAGVPAAAPAGADATCYGPSKPGGHLTLDGGHQQGQKPSHYLPQDGLIQDAGRSTCPDGWQSSDKDHTDGTRGPLADGGAHHLSPPPPTGNTNTPAGIKVNPPPTGPAPAPGAAPTAVTSLGGPKAAPASGIQVNESPLGDTPRELIIVLLAACMAGLVGGLLGLGGGMVIGE